MSAASRDSTRVRAVRAKRTGSGARKRRRKRELHARDQDASPFEAILAELVPRVPGALAAALVDVVGETVDYAGHVDAFEVRVAAAHWRLVLDEMDRARALGRPQSLVVRGTKRSFIVWALPDAYAIVVLLRRRAGFASSSRALFACERALSHEAGWSLSAAAGHWYPVTVECDRRRRPSTLCSVGNELRGARGASAEVPQALQVLGAVVGLRGRERGFRVRLESGAELTLVREPGGFWYADEAPESAAPRVPRGSRVPTSK